MLHNSTKDAGELRVSTKTLLKTIVMTAGFSGLCGLAGWASSFVWSAAPHSGLFVFSVTALISPMLIFPLVRKTHLLIETQHELEALARTDALTGVPNRRRFYEVAEAMVAQQPSGAPFAATVFDVDDFKVFNDTHGHAIGDAVLRAVAICLQKKFNSLGNDGVAFGRVGGEEFAVVLTERPALAANTIAQEIVEAVRRLRVDAGGTSLSVTISAGTVVMKAPINLDEAICEADAALYAAKAAGRDRAHFSLPESISSPTGQAAA